VALSGGGLHRRDPGGEALSDSETDLALATAIMDELGPVDDQSEDECRRILVLITAAREQDRQVMAEMYQQQNERDMERAEAAEASLAKADIVHALTHETWRRACDKAAEERDTARAEVARLHRWQGLAGQRADAAEASLAALRPLLLEAAEMIEYLNTSQADTADLEARLRKAASEETSE